MAYRVLVLEDDPDMRETLEELLQEEGYDVVAVTRGEEAVDMAQQQAFDILISDIRMDGMNGLEAIGKTRELQPGMGSLVVSGYASEQETLRAIQLNVGGYLRKPFSRQEFLQSVRGILERQTTRLDHQRELQDLREVIEWLMLRWGENLPVKTQKVGELCRNFALQADCGLVNAQGLFWSFRIWAWTQSTSEMMSDEGLLRSWLDLESWGPSERTILAAIRWIWDRWVPGTPWPRPEELPGPLSEHLLEAYRQVLDLPASSRPASAQNPARRLLALAETLEESGNEDAAIRAFRQAYDVARVPQTASTLSACLGLARLALKQRNTQAYSKWAQQAQETSLHLSPALRGSALAELGFELMSEQPERASQLLGQALTLLNPGTALAKTRLALHSLGQLPPDEGLVKDTELLMSPGSRPHLARHWQWLLPLLLGGSLSAHNLQRSIWDFEQEMSQLVRLESLPVHAIEAILDCPDIPKVLLHSLLGHSNEEVRRRAGHLKRRQEEGGVGWTLRLQSLGFFTVHCGSRRVGEDEWRTQKVKLLLAYFAAAWDRKVGEDEILEQFWPESKGATKRSLYVATTELRRLLRPHLEGEACDTDYIVREKGSLFLNLQLPVWHDLVEAEELWARAAAHEKSGRAEDAASAYRRICNLYLGPFLEGHYMDWVVRRRATWEERATAAARFLSGFSLSQNRPRDALEWSDWALNLDAADLDSHQARLQAYLQLRQPEAVLRHFEAAEKLLRREYALEPSTAMIELQQRARYGIFE